MCYRVGRVSLFFLFFRSRVKYETDFAPDLVPWSRTHDPNAVIVVSPFFPDYLFQLE
jgi:hypothetical protein